MSEAEHEAYERAKMAEQDARGALEKAEETGEARGVVKGRVKELRRSLADLCELLGIEVSEKHQEVLTTASLATLERLRDRIKQERRWPGI